MKNFIIGTLTFMMFSGVVNAQTRDTTRLHHSHHANLASQLQLTTEQKSQLKSIHDQKRQELEALKNKSLSPDQQKKQSKTLRKKYREQVQSVYTPAQKEQLRQLKMKAAKSGKERSGEAPKGSSAKHDHFSHMGHDLHLSTDQKERMEKLRSESKSQVDLVKNNQALSTEEKNVRIQEIKKQQRQQINSVLTAEQLAKRKAHHKDQKDSQ